jgi:enoyl-CoA hydratase
MSDRHPPAVLFERRLDPVALVTLNRSVARKAVNGDVARALDAIIKQTEADDDLWAAVLTGCGSQAFCAGADLQEVSSGRSKGLCTEGGGLAGFVPAEPSKP